MKQSLNAYLPKVKYVSSFEKLLQLEGKKFIFEQTAINKFDFILNKEFSIINSQLSIFIFGPEGGFSNNEMKLIDEEMKIKLTNQRLRSETAIIAAASLLAIKLTQ
jgi:16S rRNA (uracil1498-N3)-methyltransferase